jgi:hypothetical protein
MTRRVVVLTAVLATLGMSPAWASTGASRESARAFELQGRGAARPGGPRVGGAVSVAEAERLFDRYMLGQARVVLQLTPDQLVQFAQRFERLQALQRMRQRQRQRRLGELAALNRNGAGGDEADVAGLLEALDAEMADADRRVREARGALDQVLTVRQRARYRAFEVRMEREKLQLIARARAAARERAGQAGESETPDE